MQTRKVLERRKTDNVALNTNKIIATGVSSITKTFVYQNKSRIKFLSPVDAAGPAREQTEM